MVKYSALEPNKSCSVSHAFVLGLVLGGMALAFGAFYWSFNLWTSDGVDRARIHDQESRYRVVRDNNLNAKRVVDIHEQQQDMVDMLREQTSQFVFNDSTPVADPAIARYELYNQTIMAANETCSRRINELTAIVGQIINGTNSTPTNLFTGLCEFNGATINDTTTLVMTHDVIIIGGVDFYFYQFTATNATIEVGTVGARIENCDPPIFVGGDTSGTVFPSQLDQLVGQPALPRDYVSIMRVASGGLEFVPQLGADPTQTLSIMGQISVWLSVF